MNNEACASASCPPFLYLPLMHPESLSSGQPAPAAVGTAFLWPGLPLCPATHWQPAGYAFNPEEALACLADLQAMSEAALTGVPMQALVAHEHKGDAAKTLDEQNALRRFSAHGDRAEDSPADQDAAYKAAQKTLLWAWLLEERFREVRALVRRFHHGAGHLMDELGVEEDAALSGLRALETVLGEDTGLLPPWKLVLENAALFVPEGCTLVVNHPGMAADLREQAGFTPLDAALGETLRLAPQEVSRWCRAHMPLWQILGLNAAPAQRPWLLKSMTLLVPPLEPKA